MARASRMAPIYGTDLPDVIDESSAIGGVIINSRGGDDEVIGSDFADRLYLGSGDDIVEGGEGDDIIVAGSGEDTARYRGSIFDYDWSETRPGILSVTDTNTSDGDEGTDTLRGVEILQFDDFVFNIGGNNAPLVMADDQTMNEDDVYSFTVKGYDFDGGSLLLDYISMTAVPPGLNFGADFAGVSVVSGMGSGKEYTLDIDPGSALQYLGVGEAHVLDMEVSISDGQGNASVEAFQVTVEGRNDDPTVSGVTYNQSSVQEDVALTATGSVNATDIDQNDVLLYSVQGGGTGTYGSLSINGSGNWTYSLNNGSTAVQDLNAGQTVQDTFIVEVDDQNGGVVTQEVSVDVLGDDEAFTIGGSVVDFQYLAPDLASPFPNSANGPLTVSSGVEIPDLLDFTTGVSIDFTEDNFIFIDFAFDVSFAGQDDGFSFNGFQITDFLGVLPDFDGYISDSTASQGTPIPDFTQDVFSVDLKGRQFVAGDNITIEMFFA